MSLVSMNYWSYYDVVCHRHSKLVTKSYWIIIDAFVSTLLMCTLLVHILLHTTLPDKLMKCELTKMWCSIRNLPAEGIYGNCAEWLLLLISVVQTMWWEMKIYRSTKRDDKDWARNTNCSVDSFRSIIFSKLTVS